MQNDDRANVVDMQIGEAIELPVGITQQMVCERTGLSRSTVSKCCAGKYPAHLAAYKDVAAAVAALASESAGPPARQGAGAAVAEAAPPVGAPSAYLDVRPATPRAADAPWSAGQDTFAAMLMASVAEGEFSIFVAPSGAGKSFVLDRFRELNPEHVWFKARKRMSVSDVVSQLCGLWNIADAGSCDQRLQKLLRRASGRLLLVDEADLLVAGRKPDLVASHVEVFRELSEAGAAVAMVGLPVLMDQVARCCETYVFSRIGYWHRMNPPSQKELEAFWKNRTADLPGCAEHTERATQTALRQGLFRYLDKLEKRTRLMGGDVGAARTFLYRPEV